MSVDYTFYAAYGYALTLNQDKDIIKRILKKYPDADFDDIDDVVSQELENSSIFTNEFPDLVSATAGDFMSGSLTEALVIAPRSALFSADKYDTWDLQEIPQHFSPIEKTQLKEFAKKFKIKHDPQFLIWTTVS